MRCPSCGKVDDKVLESRSVRDGAAIRRRRQCLACECRFTTYEEVMRENLRVVKRDGRSEDFNLEKLTRGLLRACEKRPVTEAQVEAIIADMERAFEGESEVTTQQIGEEVMKRLAPVDQVAYIRFASVYRRFKDAGEFIHTIHEITGQNKE